VLKPGGRLVSEEVAAAIVRFVAGGSELANAEVEPSLLSLICRELNNARLAQGRAEISADLLAGSRDTILSEFYERALADQPPGVRQVIEDNLLTESGYRESLAEERLVRLLAAAGAPDGTLAKLVDRRLLRIEERLDVRRVELTHDVLCGVVRASRDLRLEREARDEAERQLAAQREREAATRRALVRARQIAIGCAVLAVVALGSAIYGYVSARRAQEAEARADATRLMAEQARGESEKLVVFLLDDFYLELAPVGRLDIVGGLAKRALDYYNALPEELRTPQTERNRALALVRYGTVLRTQSRLEEGGKAIDEAVGVLGRMREQGDRSEATAIGLALGLSIQARLASSADLQGKALPISDRAVEVIEPLATAPDSSVAARRTFGEALIMNGYLKMSNDRNEAALATLDRARATLRSIDELKLTDLAAAAAYAEATAWQVQALANLGRNDDAERVGKEGLAVAERVLEKRPGHMQALRAQALATSPLAAILVDELRPDEALAMAETTRRAWREFVRLDPGNTISWSNLGVAYLIKHFAQHELGRHSDEAATLRAALDLERESPANPLLNNNLAFMAGLLARLEANRGNAAKADEALAACTRLTDWLSSNAPADGFLRAARPLFPASFQLAVAVRLGEHRRALELGRALVPKLEQLQPTDEPHRQLKSNVLRLTRLAMAQAALATNDPATAEREMRQVLALHEGLPWRTTADKRDAAMDRALAALAFARSGHRDEAQALIAPVLAFERELAARNRDDAYQRYELAVALYVAAIAGTGDAAAQLAEANALLAGLPPETRRLRDTIVLQERIAAERARRRAS
jgi:hypothetical protein